MAIIKSSILVMAVLISISFLALVNGSNEERKVYIVGLKGKRSEDPLSDHLNLLDQVLEGSSAQEALVNSYTAVINGFAANLTEKEAQKFIGMKDKVLVVYLNYELEFMTTTSWDS